jgi:hypothetical protein
MSAGLDLYESDIIEFASERTSTASGFLLFYFDLEFWKRGQSSELINAKMPLISSFFGSWLV